MILLFLQSIVILCHHANAWSVIPARRSGSLLVGSLHTASSSLLFAKEDHGECKDSTTDSASSSLSRKPVTGDVVTFTFESFEPISDMVLEPPLFDTEGTRQLVLNGGNYLPGLHKLLSTMTPGESVTDGVNIDAGYGAYKKELAFDVSTSDFGDMDTSQIKIGTMLQMQNGVQCRVTKIENDKWTLDANHPLAGAAYGISVKLDTVENGPTTNVKYVMNGAKDDKYKVATFGLGCFWGGELMFQRVPGVISTSVGYTQGTKENPTYEEVCSGMTGHTEAVQVAYDPTVISFADLLAMYFTNHDPTQGMRQGNDAGTQYRSGVYCKDKEQYDMTLTAKKAYQEALGSTRGEITSEIPEDFNVPYYFAEDYHQQYLAKPGSRPYCSAQPTGTAMPEIWLKENGAKLSGSFWNTYGPRPGCTIGVPNEPIPLETALKA